MRVANVRVDIVDKEDGSALATAEDGGLVYIPTHVVGLHKLKEGDTAPLYIVRNHFPQHDDAVYAAVSDGDKAFLPPV